MSTVKKQNIVLFFSLGMASYTIAPAWSCHAKPANFSFEEAANYLGNYETAYHVVVHCAEAKGQLISKGNFGVFKSKDDSD